MSKLLIVGAILLAACGGVSRPFHFEHHWECPDGYKMQIEVVGDWWAGDTTYRNCISADGTKAVEAEDVRIKVYDE